MRGANIFKGYYRDEAATDGDAATTAGCTRATSASSTRDGYLTITGRKKDLIITSSGKNISPSNIENALKLSPLGVAGGRLRRPQART